MKKRSELEHDISSIKRVTKTFPEVSRCSGGNERRNASSHQCKVKMSGSEKKMNKNTYDLSLKKHETKKFLEVSHCSRAKQRQRNVQKNLLHLQNLLSG